jgi:hypothetical protein
MPSFLCTLKQKGMSKLIDGVHLGLQAHPLVRYGFELLHAPNLPSFASLGVLVETPHACLLFYAPSAIVLQILLLTALFELFIAHT